MPRHLPDHIQSATHGEADQVREHILDAAYRVIAAKGLAAASTRSIAAEAGIATGTVYNYFDNSLQLLAQAIVRQIHVLAQPVRELQQRAGKYTIAENLNYYARCIGAVLDEIVPLGAAVFSDPELLAAMQAGHVMDSPEHSAIDALEKYLRAEQASGRVSADADCRAAASIMFHICHDRAFYGYLHGGSHQAALTREIRFLAAALSSDPTPQTRRSSASR